MILSSPTLDRLRKLKADREQAEQAASGGAVHPADIDERFKSTAFRAAFRAACGYMGWPSTIGTFKQQDRRFGGMIADWRALAESAVMPWHVARCYLLDKDGKRIAGDAGPCTVCVKLHGQTRQDAGKELDTTCYEFKEWFL